MRIQGGLRSVGMEGQKNVISHVRHHAELTKAARKEHRKSLEHSMS